MNAVKTFGILLLVAGSLALAYGGFSYTKETHQARIGSLELSVNDNETVNIPIWVGVGAVALGGFLLLAPRTS